MRTVGQLRTFGAPAKVVVNLPDDLIRRNRRGRPHFLVFDYVHDFLYLALWSAKYASGLYRV
jgi:hypothetical protein